VHGFSGLQNGGNDAGMSAATADISLQSLNDFRFAGIGSFLEKRNAADNHSGSAKGALECALIEKMDFPAASLTESWQERRGEPFRRTVQAPHWPSPQPYLVPVRPRSSRNAKSKVVSGSHARIRLFPLICAWIGPAM